MHVKILNHTCLAHHNTTLDQDGCCEEITLSFNTTNQTHENSTLDNVLQLINGRFYKVDDSNGNYGFDDNGNGNVTRTYKKLSNIGVFLHLKSGSQQHTSIGHAGKWMVILYFLMLKIASITFL